MKIREYIKKLEENTKRLIETAEKCPAEKLTLKKNKEWSVIEILEHLYLTDKIIYHLIAKPSTRLSDSEELLGEQKLKNLLVQKQETKIQAPSLLHPRGDFQNISDFRTAMTAQRSALQKDLLENRIIADHRIHHHILLGDMTITDWLHFILYHSERHLKQIEQRISEK